HFTNPENSRKLAQFFPPARASLLNTEMLAATNPLLTPEQIENVVVDGITNGQVISGHTNLAQIQQTVRSSLDSLWVADADVPAVMQSVCASVAPLLARCSAKQVPPRPGARQRRPGGDVRKSHDPATPFLDH